MDSIAKFFRKKVPIKFLRSFSKYECKRFLGHKQGTIKKPLVNKKDVLLNSTGKVLILLVKQIIVIRQARNQDFMWGGGGGGVGVLTRPKWTKVPKCE